MCDIPKFWDNGFVVVIVSFTCLLPSISLNASWNDYLYEMQIMTYKLSNPTLPNPQDYACPTSV